MNYRMIKYTLGLILLFEAAFFAIPAIAAVCFLEWQALIATAISALISAGIGLILALPKPKDTKLYTKDGFVIVSLSWIVLSLVGALPYFLSREIPSYLDAVFETVSGFSTTGSTILADVEALPYSLLLWRSFTNWIGGMGVLVFIMAILPLSGAQNMHIMRAESPGPSVSKLVPRVKKTALILYSIYVAMTLIQLILLIPDLGFYEALNAALATAGTGGFGVKGDSFISYSSYTQIVCTVFMLLFSINFNSYYLLLRRKPKDAFNSEVKVFLGIVAVAVTVITLDVFLSSSAGGDTVGSALKHSAFSVATVLSTCGFASVDFNLWPTLSKTLLVLLMFVGACAGSTGGGMKVSRIIILLKNMGKEVRMLIHPKQVKKITVDNRPVEHEVVRSVTGYFVAYVMIFVISLIILSFDNYVVTSGSALVTNFTATVAAINNIGPGLDMVGPMGNYAFFSPLSKLVLIFDMLTGRLEVFPMLLLFSRETWKK